MRWTCAAFLLLLLLPSPASGQTNIRGGYATGQVWIAWETSAPHPSTYAVFRADTMFTDTSQAELIGRLYPSEWQPAAIRDQLTELGLAGYSNWVIPDLSGGTITLPPDDALFVDTVDEGPDGTRWYGVVRWGDTLVTAGVNLIEVPWTFDPLDPPQCHLQYEDVLPAGHAIRVYSLWAHGQDDHWNGRDGFPVMGNRHKNGMPSMFLLFESATPGAPPFPVTYWLHGGGGEAFTSRPTGRPKIDIEPIEGLLVAHNDDVQRPLYNFETEQWALISYVESNSWWFGYSQNQDPFAPSYTPADTDTLINYTQRRLIWIHDWLIANEDVDPDRAAIQGHSMGAAGATHMAKTFPNTFSTATVFNNGFHTPTGDSAEGHFLGTPEQDLRTSLERTPGDFVRVADLFDLTTPTSDQRDLPLIRMIHGKNDCCGVMTWDAEVVAEYRKADSSGIGAHLYWDLREHGWSGIPGYWTEGGDDALQTGRDDVARQETWHVSRSYPAFFNLQASPDSITGDPGDGSRGSVSGDDWGTWGGYHVFSPATLTDTPGVWQAAVFLLGLSTSHPRDNSPVERVVSDVAIRRPQLFLPNAGDPLRWFVFNMGGDTLQTGVETVEDDGLVVAHGVEMARDPERRILRIERVPPSSTPEPPATRRFLAVAPNPFRSSVEVTLSLEHEAHAILQVFDSQGRKIDDIVDQLFPSGRNPVVWKAGSVPPGVYFLRALVDGETFESRRVLKLE